MDTENSSLSGVLTWAMARWWGGGMYFSGS